MNLEKIISIINANQIQQLDLSDELTKHIVKILISHHWIDEKKQQLQKVKKPQLVCGTLDVKMGFAFLIGEHDYYIKDANNYFSGDEVIAFIDPNKPGKDEAIIIDLINRPQLDLVVKVNDNHNIVSILPAYENYHFSLRQKILPPIGSYIKVTNPVLIHGINYVDFESEIAFDHSLGKDVNLILASNNISVEFSHEALKEAEAKENKDYQNLTRKDLTDLAFITIDGTYSKDFDDAIYLEKQPDYYHLYVSIADVSNFVNVGSELDQNAYARGNSVYFLNYVIPMLPFKLSNDLCSLNPNVKRYTMTCEMKITKDGEMQEYLIYPSIIKSHRRCTYQEVNDYLMRGTLNQDLVPLQQMLDDMDELREILFQERSKKGSFMFEEQEVSFEVDEQQNILHIVPVVRENAEKLVEEFMIKANECVASIINQMELPFIYRIHDHPDPQQILALKEQLHNLNINIKNNAYEYNNFYHEIKQSVSDPASLSIIDKLLIRSLPKAKYQTTNIGHYGLALENYTHFTSPIRRYADLLVHRLLKKYLIDCNYEISSEEIKHLDTAAKHLTQCEINAQNAERSIIDLKKTIYCQQFVGQNFVGKISNIYENKMIIELPNTIRGSVFLTDYYDFVGIEDFNVKFKDHTYHLLDPIEIQIKNVDINKQKIVFKLSNYKQKPLFKKQGRKKTYGKKPKNNKFKTH